MAIQDPPLPSARSKACPVALPITKAAFDDVIATMRHEVEKQYTEHREKFMDATLGSSHEDRKKRAAAEVDKDFVKLKKANPLLAGSDPFKATWLPGRGDIPSIPPREVAAAATKGQHPLEPKEGLSLDEFMLTSDRLLAMTVEEIRSISYIDGWIFKYVLTRYFDFVSAATRFLKLREVFHKYNLTFTHDDAFGPMFGGGFALSSMYAQYSTDIEYDLPPEPTAAEVLPESKEDHNETEEKKLRALHPYRSHRAPIVMARARFNDFSKCSIENYKRGWFFFISCLTASSYYEQTHGHVMIMSGKNSGMANMSREFGSFAAEAVQNVVAIKVQRVFMVHQGWFFNNIMAPLVGLLFSKKMIGKMHVSSDPKCKEVILECGEDRVSAEFGGTMPLSDGGSEVCKWMSALIGKEEPKKSGEKTEQQRVGDDVKEQSKVSDNNVK